MLLSVRAGEVYLYPAAMPDLLLSGLFCLIDTVAVELGRAGGGPATRPDVAISSQLG